MPRKEQKRLNVITVVVALLALGLAGSGVRVPYASTTQATYRGNVGELVGSREVGQSFESVRPRLSAVAFQVATYSGRANTEDVIFELRHRPEDEKPLRTVRVNARRLRDHQRFAFTFPPLPDSQGRTYYASLRSPGSRPGNAITVDVSNENPYEKTGPSSLVVLRQERRRAPDVAAGTKPEADLAFAVIHDIALRERLRLAAQAGSEAVASDPARWRLDARLATVAALLALTTVGVAVRHHPLLRQNLLPFVFGALLILGLFLRLLFANHLPHTNDEGTALYDAWTLLQGRLPGGDGVLKAPVYLGILAGGLSLLGPSLIAGRLVSILAGVLTAFPLASLARRLGGRTAAPLTVGSLWLLAATPAIFSVYTHAQSVQLLFVSLGLAVLAAALRTGKAPPRDHRRSLGDTPVAPFTVHGLALLAGVLFALALGARKTSLAIALPAVILVLGSQLPWRRRVYVLATSLIGFLLVLGALTALEFSLYGGPGVRYFLGIDVANIDPETTGSPEERRSAFIKGVVPFFREGLPLIFWALVGIGGGLEMLARHLVRPASRLRFPFVSLWLMPLALAWVGGTFLRTHERGEHFAFGLWPFWITMSVAVLVIALLPRRQEIPSGEGEQHQGNSFARMLRSALPLLVPVAWLSGTALVYASWIKFTANYLAEFLPAVTLLAAGGVWWFAQMFGKRPLVLVLAGVLTTWGSFSAARLGHTFPHTGTFDLSSIEETARYLAANVPKEEPVLTAAVAVPFLSGHRVLFDVAHPTHYAYGFIEPSVRNIYMEPAEEMVRAVREDVRWFIHEQLTAFSYFREYPEIKNLVEEEFEQVAEIENLSNPITIFRRRASN